MFFNIKGHLGHQCWMAFCLSFQFLQYKFLALTENLHPCCLHNGIIENGGEEYSCGDEQPDGGEGICDDIRQRHHYRGRKDKRRYVLQHVGPAIANQSAGIVMPWQQPEYHESGVGTHHDVHAVAVKRQYDGYLKYYLENVEPHIDIASSSADGKVLIHGIYRQEGSADAQCLQQWHARLPFRTDGDEYELTGHRCQTEHQRHGEETREASHLAVYPQLSCVVILRLVTVSLHQHRLRYLPYGVGDERARHGVPFVCLRVAAHLRYVEEAAEDYCEYVSAHGVDNLRYENLQCERCHALHRSHVKSKARPPLSDVVVASEVQHCDVGYLLPCQCPVALAEKCQRDTYGAGGYQRCGTYDGHLTVHHVLGHVATVRNAERGDYEGKEQHP